MTKTFKLDSEMVSTKMIRLNNAACTFEVQVSQEPTTAQEDISCPI